MDRVKRGVESISVGKANFVHWPLLECKISKSFFSSKHKVELITESKNFEVFESTKEEHCLVIKKLVYDLNSAIFACDWDGMQRIIRWIESGPIFGAESRRKHEEALEAACFARKESRARKSKEGHGACFGKGRHNRDAQSDVRAQ